MIGDNIFEALKEKYKEKEKFKILFCPYKEEMWDSMETIYEAAVRDKDTECDIMPIPYFRLQNLTPYYADIEFAACAGKFPWRLNYGWDVIIFHYPYDQFNKITRPILYSSHLKLFCKHLVSIHYACRGENDIEDRDALLPGIKNSDLVIYETEQQAQHAQRILTAYCKWQGECVAWGSPKFDKIGKCTIMPDEWKEKIGNRKTVLLQTSLMPYMANENKLEQIKKVIEDNKDKCIIWRPHPLLEATIVAHRPEDFEPYMALKEEFINSNNILDETDKPQLAISIADEMISDKSSLVTLWKSTGKKLTMLE